MDKERWQLIQDLFHKATALTEPDRIAKAGESETASVLRVSPKTAFLREACGSDREMLLELTSMIEADNRSASIIDRGLSAVAGEVITAADRAIQLKEVGQYRLIRFIGEGGMGVVYLAQRKDAGNYVAIKFLLHAGLSPARRERFAREIKLLGKLNHPAIARLYDAGTLDDGTPWL